MYDTMLLKYGLKLQDLEQAAKKHSLDSDADVQAVKALALRSREQKATTMQQLVDLSPDDVKVIKQAVMEMLPVLKINPVTHMMPLDSYIILVQALIKTGLKIREAPEKAHLKKRRELLKAGDLEGYKEEVIQFH